jgi:hypothetical protein
MPEKEGLETLRELRQLSRDVPVIAVSGGGIGDAGHYLAAARHFGASRILQKPFGLDDLRSIVAELLFGEHSRTDSHTPQAEPQPRVDTLWEFRKDGVTWSCELRSDGEHGVEAHILRNGDRVASQRFNRKEAAASWAERERVAIEKGGT